MPSIEYAVRVVFPDHTLVEPYLRWLTGGHIRDVIAGGASTGYALLETEPADAPTVVSRYLFPSRQAFDRYVQDTAPKLRAEGLEKFGPHTGIVMHRTIGVVHEPG